MDRFRSVGQAGYRTLDAVEDAAPVDAVEAVTREVGRTLGAADASFMIADLAGAASSA